MRPPPQFILKHPPQPTLHPSTEPGMVAVYCRDEIQRALVARSLIGLPVSTTGNQAEFEDRIQGACSAAVVLPDLEDEGLAWFGELRRLAPYTVPVLVTRFTPSMPFACWS